jgi:hypothetical protein
MRPIAWVYVLTRAKRGFQQSMVQTLLILPVVVAGVITIVKNSIALAFGLAGIVTAVSFRIPAAGYQGRPSTSSSRSASASRVACRPSRSRRR